MTTTVEAEETNREEGNAALIAALREEVTTSEVEAGWELDVMNDTERGRWIATLGADAIGELTYRFVAGRAVLLSIWVGHAYRNRDVARELIYRVLDEIREADKKITIICPVVGEFIARNPEYLDLVDEVHPGSGANAHQELAVGADADEHLAELETNIGQGAAPPRLRRRLRPDQTGQPGQTVIGVRP